jgi:hypothetical protein
LNGTYYDPSYGVTYANLQAFDNVLAGFYIGGLLDVSESYVSMDLNNDGDMNDVVSTVVFAFRQNPAGVDVQQSVGNY